MKRSGIWLMGAGMALGLALGVVWNPRGGESEQAQSGGSSGARRGVSGGGEANGGISSKSSRYRAHRARRASGSGVGELTRESLIQSFMGVVNEEEADLMQLARYCAMITTMGESEAHDLLHALALPQEGDHEDAGDIRGIISAIVFTRLCELDGPEAMRMAAAGELGEEFEEEFTILGMNSWVAADPEGVSDWLDGQLVQADELVAQGGEGLELEGTMRLWEEDEFIAAVTRGLAKHDAGALAERVGQIESAEVRESMETAIFEASVANENTAEGLVTLLQHEGEEGHDGRLEAIRKLRELDMTQAAGWVEGTAVSSERDEMVSLVADKMLDVDPASGAEWYMAQEMSGDNERTARMERIVSNWGHKDLEAADEWLSAQPDDGQRERSETRLVQMASYQKDWPKAMIWIVEISDQAARDAALRDVLRRGYNRQQGVMNAELYQAAEEAGFGEAAKSYQGQ